MEAREGTYVVVQSFMVRDLKLGGNELMIYATIYGFSQDGESWFTGSASYLAAWAQCSKNTVYRLLAKLTDAGLIEKRTRDENGVTLVDYRAVPVEGGTPKMGQPITNRDGGTPKMGVGGTPKMGDHNIDIDNKEDIYRGKRKRFTAPTRDEVREYHREKGFTFDADTFYDYFDAGGWKDSRGNQVKSWKQKMITWQSREDRGKSGSRAVTDGNRGEVRDSWADFFGQRG